jgi:hypothetical protein
VKFLSRILLLLLMLNVLVVNTGFSVFAHLCQSKETITYSLNEAESCGSCSNENDEDNNCCKKTKEDECCKEEVIFQKLYFDGFISEKVNAIEKVIINDVFCELYILYQSWLCTDNAKRDTDNSYIKYYRYNIKQFLKPSPIKLQTFLC